MVITKTHQIFLDGTDITDLVNMYSDPERKLNSSGNFSFTVEDQEFTLYNSYINGVDGTKWMDCQFLIVQLLDYDSQQFLFIGRVSIPTFYEDHIDIVCDSMAKTMQDRTIPGNVANFIYAEGKVKTLDYDGDAWQLELCENNDAEDPFTWDDDQWIDKGILINDETELEETTWIAENALLDENFTDDGGTITGGGIWTNTDDDIYLEGNMKFIGSGYKEQYFDLEITGDAISMALDIVSINIKYDIKITVPRNPAYPGSPPSYYQAGWGALYIYNYHDAAWERIVYSGQVHNDTILKSSVLIVTNPAYYLDDDAVDYTTIKIRVWLAANDVSGYVPAIIGADFLQVVITDQTTTISPMQAEITDNGASWIAADVAIDFADLGVSVNDTFQIGERSDIILTTVFAFYNIPIEIDPSFSRYLARNFKGFNATDVLNAVCLLEGAEWWEYYYDDGTFTIRCFKAANFRVNGRAHTIFEDTFEDLTNWSLTTTKGTIAIESTFDGYTNVAKLNHTAAGLDLYMTTTLTGYVDYGVLCIELDLQFTNNNDDENFIIELKNDGSDTIFKIYIDVEVLKAINGITITTLGAMVDDTWHNLRIEVDLDNTQMDVYINRILVASELAIPNVGTPALLKISNENVNEQLYIDNVKISDPIVSSIDRKEFSIERSANYISSVRGLGNPLKGLDVIVQDPSITSPLEDCIVDQSINTEPDLIYICQNYLNNHKSLQPSLKIVINNSNNSCFNPGELIYLNLSVPVITEYFPVRKVAYKYNPVGLKKTILFLGLGLTDPNEHFIENQKKLIDWIRKAHLYAQNPAAIVASLSYNDLTNKPTLLVAGDITYENLDANGDVGTGAGQLAIGNHNHNLNNLAEKSYNSLDNKPTIPTASDIAYDEGTWNANTDVPTKNAVRDEIEAILASIPASLADIGVSAVATGIFKAVYNFEDDTVGGNPTGWTVYETGGTVNIIASVGTHNKVVELVQSVGANQVAMYQTFSDQATGTVEFWVRFAQTNRNMDLGVFDGDSGHGAYFAARSNGNWGYYDGSWHDIVAYAANTWYHIRLVFTCGSNWSVGIMAEGGSETVYGPYNFRVSATNMDRVLWYSDVSAMTTYIDAVGYSWETDYDVGDNLKEKKEIYE